MTFEEFDADSWMMEMTEKDQDSCGKKLVCELRARQKNNEELSVSSGDNCDNCEIILSSGECHHSC